MDLVSRSEARGRGLLFYFDGKPCKRGHVSKRYKNGACVECSLDHSRRQARAENAKEYRRKYYQTHKAKPENLAADRARHARWRKTEKGQRNTRGYFFNRSYGITVDQFEAMVARQGNACAICGKTGDKEKHRRLSVDHNHATNSVRELLCDDCNVGLGQFLDNPDLLEAAAKYLRRHKPGG